MELVSSVAQLNSILKDFRKEYGRVQTNCFLMSAEVNKLISGEDMYFAKISKWLILLCEHSDYINLYYYCTADAEPFDINILHNGFDSDKNILIDFVSKNENSVFHPAIDAMIAEGKILKYKKYKRMKRDVLPTDCGQTEIADGYKFIDNTDDYQTLIDLWNDVLDEKSIPLPGKSEIAEMLDKKELFMVADKQDKICGTIISIPSGKQSLIQHVAVSTLHRRKGLAQSLLNYSFNDACVKEIKFLNLWVDCKNTPAISLYIKNQFVFDGMICDQLIVKGR
ncbi:MAG: GNAT family N-acetyltransferase [Acutalibacteraceae bacterium]